jgi:hypothetical protein
MGQITFLFGIHNHQPVGNFEWVFKDALNQCYAPFLDVLSRHPKVRLSLHHTGPLLEWMEENSPGYFKTLQTLVDRNQIELMGGAFYEPLISTLPERDAIGQIRMMSQYLEDKFGKKPRGMWLAERVWEPQLASIVKEAGMQYTLLDDTHFYYAGLQDPDMFGYYTTEDKGKTLSIFPINKNLRYLIPFNTPEKAIEYLGSVAVDYEGRGVTIGDDGEKFGLWPGTHSWVFEQGYLERLFTLLEENSHWIKTTTFSDYLDQNKSIGRIYLPTASYEEMMEWSLPTHAQKLFHSVSETLKEQGQYDRFRPFIRGGLWRNFFSKYPESNLMHKKMIYVSDQVAKLPDGSKGKKAAQKELWRGQCNCPYWHGLFGGLYLNYLRHANYSHLIQAENILLNESNHANDIAVQELDYNCDNETEIMVSTKDLSAYIQPAYGGSVSEIDYRPKFFNITNVMTRREESYHAKIAEAQLAQGNANQPVSIHDLNAVKETGLESLLHYDWYTRFSFLDHFIKPGTSLKDFYQCRFREEGDFVNQPYQVISRDKKDKVLEVVLERRGNIYRESASPYSVLLRKTYKFDAKSSHTMTVDYEIIPQSSETLEVWFGVELNLTLLAGNDKKRHFLFNSKASPKPLLGTQGEIASCQNIQMVNEEDGFNIRIALGQSSSVWYFPVETISQSESGVEKTYQGSCIFSFLKTKLEAKTSLKYSVELSVK